MKLYSTHILCINIIQIRSDGRLSGLCMSRRNPHYLLVFFCFYLNMMCCELYATPRLQCVCFSVCFDPVPLCVFAMFAFQFFSLFEMAIKWISKTPERCDVARFVLNILMCFELAFEPFECSSACTSTGVRQHARCTGRWPGPFPTR